MYMKFQLLVWFIVHLAFFNTFQQSSKVFMHSVCLFLCLYSNKFSSSVLFLSEIMCSFSDQMLYLKHSNIQSFSIHNTNISTHLNLILIYCSIYKEL